MWAKGGGRGAMRCNGDEAVGRGCNHNSCDVMFEHQGSQVL